MLHFVSMNQRLAVGTHQRSRLESPGTALAGKSQFSELRHRSAQGNTASISLR